LPQKPWSGRILFGDGWIGYFGPGGPATSHKHHTYQLVSLFGDPFAKRPLGASIVLPKTLHVLDSTGLQLALIMVEPAGLWGISIAHRVRQLGADHIDAFCRELATPPWSDPPSLVCWSEAALSALGCQPDKNAVPGPVGRSLEYIEKHLEQGRPRLELAAKAAGLSPSRLTHLFSEVVGLPFRRYVLWARVKRVVRLVGQGANLTDAAIAAGFSDQAHLSRTFRDMVGLRPSDVLLGVDVTT
jgi:AraC-like DNA-binding protein